MPRGGGRRRPILLIAARVSSLRVVRVTTRRAQIRGGVRGTGKGLLERVGLLVEVGALGTGSDGAGRGPGGLGGVVVSVFGGGVGVGGRDDVWLDVRGRGLGGGHPDDDERAPASVCASVYECPGG